MVQLRIDRLRAIQSAYGHAQQGLSTKNRPKKAAERLQSRCGSCNDFQPIYSGYPLCMQITAYYIKQLIISLNGIKSKIKIGKSVK